MNAQPANNMRVELPPQGGAGCFTIFAIFILFFVGVAAYNLMHFTALTPIQIGGSALWIFICVACVVDGIISVGGVRRASVRCLGVFSRKAFAEVCQQLEDHPTFRYGFEFWGQDYEYERIEVARIETVYWNTGQATAMNGYDCHDWTVFISFWITDVSNPSDHGLLDPNRGLIDITPHLTKFRAIAVGRPVGDMLIAAGLPLRLRDDDRGFYRSDLEDNVEGRDHD